MITKLQRYKISLVREESGKWVVLGYWEYETPKSNNVYAREWIIDGSRLEFDTRMEALNHLLNSTGIPD